MYKRFNYITTGIFILKDIENASTFRNMPVTDHSMRYTVKTYISASNCGTSKEQTVIVLREDKYKFVEKT